MALFLLHDPSSNTWHGPFEDVAIRRALADGKIEPTLAVPRLRPPLSVRAYDGWR